MLTAFTKSLLLITAAELGDKTFFIAAILAMRHPRRWVFIGSVAALILMTLISTIAGKAVSFAGDTYIRYGEIILFLGFGFKLLYDGWRMPVNSSNDDERIEAEREVGRAESKLGARPTPTKILIEAFALTFIAEWGDRTQISTITLGAANDAIGVFLGGISGHIICAAIAVFTGKLIVGRISERTITLVGGGLFILFAILSARSIDWASLS
jgi:Ca2+/H+ antiporter, TMEM165/GDT1 family